MSIKTLSFIRLMGIAIMASLLLAISLNTAMARKNPAACYCEAMGYEYAIEATPEGETGYCTLPEGQKVDAWDFLFGEVAVEYNYCQKNGYELKIVDDWETCAIYGMPPCAVCILEDGSEVEITELMNLDLIAGECGDGICSYSETAEDCPQDCGDDQAKTVMTPSDDQKVDDDTGDGFSSWIIGVIVVVALTALAALYFRQKKGEARITSNN